MIILVLVILILAAVVLMIAPSPKYHRADVWRKTPFAHRGLHDRNRMENSLEAFEAACKHDFGIELDVQLSRDGAVVVFHDDTLLRMTGDSRRVDQVSIAELKRLSLQGKGTIPTLQEALNCVGGRVPLLVEIKNGKRNRELCEKTMALLSTYPGKYIVESFNPMILRWLRRHAPQVVRGQLVGSSAAYLAKFGPIGAFFLSTLSLNILGRPDFVAYDISANFSAPRIQRALFHTPMAAWTVKDETTYQICMSRNECPIFEGFLPRRR